MARIAGCCAQGADLSPEEVTRLNMDKSALLQRLIEEYGGNALMLLGELQVSTHITCCAVGFERTQYLTRSCEEVYTVLGAPRP